MNIQNELMTKAEHFLFFKIFRNCEARSRLHYSPFLIRIRWQLLKDIILEWGVAFCVTFQLIETRV